MDLWKSAVVGLVQGLTEFLPVSSSAHIVFAEQLLGIQGSRLDLAIVVHLGTLIAVFGALWYRLAPVVMGTLGGIGELARRRSPWGSPEFRWGTYIVVGTIPAAVIGYLFESRVEAAFSKPFHASIMLLVTGGILFATRYVRSPGRDMGFVSGIVVGLAQAVAILPGISRSGSTISAALFCKVEREKAAEFSFLLAVPVILGGAVLWFLEFADGSASSDGLSLLVGMVVAMVFGFLAIKLLLAFVRRGRLSWFAYYCWAAGLAGLFLFSHREAHSMETGSTLPLRVMTFNIRFPSPNDQGNLWTERREIVAAMLHEKNPDVIGIQEAYRTQLVDLARSLPEYGILGRERRGGTEEEHCAILFRRERFMVESSGTYWLSETPDVPGSRTWWPDDHPRIVSWAALIDLPTAQRIRVYTTHFPLSREQPERRIRSANLIWSRLRADSLPEEMPVVFLGDFNARPESEVHDLLTGKQPFEDGTRASFRDVWELAQNPVGRTSTVHGFSGTSRREGARIDWILVGGPVRVSGIETVTFNREGKYPSDHFPVVADLVIAKGDREGR